MIHSLLLVTLVFSLSGCIMAEKKEVIAFSPCEKDLLQKKYIPPGGQAAANTAHSLCAKLNSEQISIAKNLIDEGFYIEDPNDYSGFNFLDAVEISKRYPIEEIECSKKDFKTNSKDLSHAFRVLDRCKKKLSN